MAFNNPNRSWKEMEAILSGRPLPGASGARGKDGRQPGSPSWNAGGDGPAWGRKRQPYEPAVAEHTPGQGRTPYAELHCHSNFSFLDGASHPEALVEEAHRLGLEALALTDHDGLYGIVRFAEAARAVGLPTVFGAEISLTAEGRRARSEADDDPDRTGCDHGVGGCGVSSIAPRSRASAGVARSIARRSLAERAARDAARSRWLTES